MAGASRSTSGSGSARRLALGRRLLGRQPRRRRRRPIEISLFGPGYGESLALHLGGGEWIIVDSCIDSETGEPATLQYLLSLGVDVARDVSVVLTTHWHDDHIRGLARVVECCSSARFYCSLALRNDEFLTLIESPARVADRITPGTREFGRVLQLLRDRGGAGSVLGTPNLVQERTLIRQTRTCQVMALSPSAASVQQSLGAFAALLPEPLRPHLRVAAPTPNHASVALWVRADRGHALLGADLENTKQQGTGWDAVLALQPAEHGKAGLVKISHHGSNSGHHEGVWSDLLVAQPAAALTPWRLAGNALPTEEDRKQICNLAPETVIAGRLDAALPRYEPAVERTLREAVISRKSALGRMGHVRASLSTDGGWNIERVRFADRLCL